MLSDVVVQQAGGNGHLLAISPDPGVAAERLMLELAGAGSAATLDVEVTESRPVIVEGAVRHRLELEVHEVVAHAIPGAPRASAG